MSLIKPRKLPRYECDCCGREAKRRYIVISDNDAFAVCSPSCVRVLTKILIENNEMSEVD
jgi:hypothetical protein